nr:MAG TPA: hypothetical protein [Caudoviricetes sp.]
MWGCEMDFLSEMCARKDTEYFSGTYYNRRPSKPSDVGEKFTYEMVDPRSREYRTIIGNLLVEGTSTAIKTRSSIEFKEKQYIVTQDGKFWQIAAVTETIQTEQSKQALRFFVETAQTEKTIRLIGKDNPWGLQ